MNDNEKKKWIDELIGLVRKNLELVTDNLDNLKQKTDRKKTYYQIKRIISWKTYRNSRIGVEIIIK